MYNNNITYFIYYKTQPSRLKNTWLYKNRFKNKEPTNQLKGYATHLTWFLKELPYNENEPLKK